MFHKSQKSKVKSQKSKVKRLQLVIYTFAFYLLPFTLNAQCAMCRAALQSEESAAQAEGINDGIVYLMIVPYVLVAIAGFAIYKLKYGKK
jgi:heme/copper-type cytochrome/quinol oxidase subunit 2